MYQEKKCNLIILFFFILFFISSILLLFSFISLNLTRTINSSLVLFSLISVLFFQSELKINGLIVLLTSFYSFIYFNELLFLPNLFDYLLIITTILIIIIIIKDKIKIKQLFILLKQNSSTILSFIFLVCWFIYSFSALFWAKDRNLVFHRFQFIIFSILIFLSYLYICYIKKLDVLAQTLFYLSLFFIIISFLEIKFNVHFPNTHAARMDIKNLPCGTTWNINDFATFLYICSFFLLIFLVYNFKNFYIYILIALSSFFIFIFYIKKTDSRANLYGYYLFIFFLIFLTIFFFLVNVYRNIITRKYRLIYLIVLALTLILLISFIVNLAGKKIILISDLINKYKNIYNASINPKTRYLNSDILRIRLILNALKMLRDSYFLGVGPGNSIKLMPMYSEKYYITKVGDNVFVNIHNFWVELLTEYGIVVFLIFICFYCLLLIKSLEIAFSKKANSKCSLISIIIFSTLIGFIISSISESSLLTRPVVWIYLFFANFNLHNCIVCRNNIRLHNEKNY